VRAVIGISPLLPSRLTLHPFQGREGEEELLDAGLALEGDDDLIVGAGGLAGDDDAFTELGVADVVARSERLGGGGGLP
jgi:hypothetical protein